MPFVIRNSYPDQTALIDAITHDIKHKTTNSLKALKNFVDTAFEDPDKPQKVTRNMQKPETTHYFHHFPVVTSNSSVTWIPFFEFKDHSFSLQSCTPKNIKFRTNVLLDAAVEFHLRVCGYKFDRDHNRLVYIGIPSVFGEKMVGLHRKLTRDGKMHLPACSPVNYA